jgi:DNA replication protein DnaC
LAHQACRQDYSVRYFRVPRLTDELLSAGAQQKKSAFFKLLAKADLLVLDDFGLTPLAEPFKRDLLEIVDDRFDKKSTLITSQMPVAAWHAHLDDPTLADAILDRLIHNAYQIELKGESMRKRKPLERTTKT